MGTARAALILTAFLLLSLPLMPIQAALIRVAPKAARQLPFWYHRVVCRLVGVRIHVRGHFPAGRPTLIAANHTSWLDILVLSAVTPVSFVAKAEVARWPFVGTLARLQRSVFVDRSRRTAVSPAAEELAGRLVRGDTIVLFAEGTSSDGNRVLPFMSSLFAAVTNERNASAGIAIVPLALAYTARNGIRLGREERPKIGWYGDMEMTRHAWSVLKGGPIDVEIRIGSAVQSADTRHRKTLAAAAETHVRRLLVGALRGRHIDDPLQLAATSPSSAVRMRPRRLERGSTSFT